MTVAVDMICLVVGKNFKEGFVWGEEVSEKGSVKQTTATGPRFIDVCLGA